jgi:hypothetical protein
MCKEKEFVEENIENNEYINLEDMSKEELIDVVYELANDKSKEVAVNLENVQSLEFEADEFEKGLKSVSYICGMITGLSNVGLNKEQIMDYVVNEQNIKFNKNLNKMTCDSNEKTAKIQNVQIQQQMI